MIDPMPLLPRGYKKNILIAVCVNIVVWELIIRLLISSPCTQMADSTLGYMNEPLTRFIFSSEGYSRERFNRIGFNDKDTIPGTGIKRMFVVGDSYSESFQLAQSKSYVQLLENKLNEPETSQTVDVIKLARDGFNPAHYPLVIDRFIDDFQPDLIVLQFWNHSGGDLYSPYIACEYDEAGNVIGLELSQSSEDIGKDALRIVINNSALIYHALRRYKPYIMKTVGWFSGLGNFLQKQNSVTKNNEDEQYDAGKEQRSLDDMKKKITFIVEEIMSHNTELLIFYIPRPGIYFQGDNKQVSDTLQALKTVTGVKGVPFVDLSNSIKEYYINNVNPLNGFANTFPGTGHLNAQGHNLIAQELFTYLEKYKLFQ